MALRTNGTVGNYIRRASGTMPNWGSSAFIGFFQLPTNTGLAENLLQFGGSGGFVALPRSTANVLACYHDWGSWPSTLTTAVVGRWYAFYVGANGTAGKMMLKDMSTGTVYSTGGTNPGGWASTVPEVWLGSYTYGARSTALYCGWKLFNASLTDTEINAEWTQLLPVRQTNVIGAWPMTESTKAANLIDITGTGDFVETGTAITVDNTTPPVPYGVPAVLRQFGFRFFNDDGIATV